MAYVERKRDQFNGHLNDMEVDGYEELEYDERWWGGEQEVYQVEKGFGKKGFKGQSKGKGNNSFPQKGKGYDRQEKGKGKQSGYEQKVVTGWFPATTKAEKERGMNSQEAVIGVANGEIPRTDVSGKTNIWRMSGAWEKETSMELKNQK